MLSARRDSVLVLVASSGKQLDFVTRQVVLFNFCVMVYVCSATRSFPWSLTAADFERIHMIVEPGGVQEAAQATAAVLVTLWCVFSS